MSVCVLLCIAVVLLLDALAKFRPYRKQVNFIFRADRPANHSSDSASNIHWQQQQQHLPLATCPLPAASCQLRVASCQLPAASCQLPLDVRKPQTQISTTAATQRRRCCCCLRQQQEQLGHNFFCNDAKPLGNTLAHLHTFAFGWLLWIRVFGFYCF